MESMKSYKKIYCVALIALAAIIITVFFGGRAVVKSASLSELQDLQQQLEDAKNSKESLEDQLKDLAEALQNAKEESYKDYDKIGDIEAEKIAQMTELDLAIMDLEHIYASILGLEKAIEEAQKEYDDTLALFLSRTRLMYRYTNYDSLRLFVESENIFDFANRSKTFANLLEKDKQIMDSLKILKADLDFKKTMQEEASVDAEKLLAEKEAIVEALKNNEEIAEDMFHASRDAVLALEQREKAMEQKADALADEITRLQKEYKAMVEEIARQQEIENKTMIWPVPDYVGVTSLFGMRFHPILHRDILHTGIDIGAYGGSNILSVRAGVVIEVDYDEDGYGNYVVVAHDNEISTLYAHCRKVLVKEGDTVVKGQVIALVGTTGMSTGNHLHFEVRVNGVQVDPFAGYQNPDDKRYYL